MNTLEFAKEVVTVLNDADLSNVIKKAASYGFAVQGFKSPWKAPRSQIIGGGLARKKRGGDCYYVPFLKAVADSQIELEDETSLSVLVKKWIVDEGSHEEISEQLKKWNQQRNEMNQKVESKEIVKVQMERGIYDDEMKKKNTELQEKNKLLRQINQNNKIALDNAHQKNKQLQKENEKLMREVERCATKNQEIVNTLKELENLLVTKDKQIDELANEIEELEKYKQRAPKILCFCKRRVDEIDLKGYDITFENSWNEEVKERVLNKIFTEIWYISKGFSYDVSLDIQETFNRCEIKRFSNYEKMLSTIGG